MRARWTLGLFWSALACTSAAPPDASPRVDGATDLAPAPDARDEDTGPTFMDAGTMEQGLDDPPGEARDGPEERPGMDALGDPTDAWTADADSAIATMDADPGEAPSDLGAPPADGSAPADDGPAGDDGAGATDTTDAAEAGGYTRPPRIEVPPLPPPPDLSALPFPRSDAGRPILLQMQGIQLELDPTLRDAVTAHGQCLDLVTRCFSPPSRSLDACTVWAPVCATARPWEEPGACCPSACVGAYERLRGEGRPELEAFTEVYLERRECFPGLLESIRGAP
ncbi:MAG: hypothetical protein HY909_15420 [Deltaproteobacteria bacterium]|nr:hypothetical protein [Deltaproteobacteria bacterium]